MDGTTITPHSATGSRTRIPTRSQGRTSTTSSATPAGKNWPTRTRFASSIRIQEVLTQNTGLAKRLMEVHALYLDRITSLERSVDRIANHRQSLVGREEFAELTQRVEGVEVRCPV